MTAVILQVTIKYLKSRKNTVQYSTKHSTIQYSIIMKRNVENL